MRARTKQDAGLAAECLLAMQGRIPDEDDDDVTDTARAYVGAIMVAEGLAELKQLRRDMVEFMKALSR